MAHGNIISCPKQINFLTYGRSQGDYHRSQWEKMRNKIKWA